MAVALEDFAKYVRPEVPDCPDILIADALLRTCIDFCTRTELLSEIVELVTSATLATYPVTPTDADLYPARLRAVIDANGLPLEKTDAASYALRTDRNEAGSPLVYFAPTRNQLTFAPIPNAVETIELDVVLRPTRTATVVPDVLYDEWASTIAHGAKGLLLAMGGMPWGNLQQAALYGLAYDADVRTATVEAAAGNVGGAMRIAVTPI
jgi:hypothetical protein